ncbi:MAG: hypothetical protein ACM3U1_02065 [Chloroflexota bacterium]
MRSYLSFWMYNLLCALGVFGFGLEHIFGPAYAIPDAIKPLYLGVLFFGAIFFAGKLNPVLVEKYRSLRSAKYLAGLREFKLIAPALITLSALVATLNPAGGMLPLAALYLNAMAFIYFLIRSFRYAEIGRN